MSRSLSNNIQTAQIMKQTLLALLPGASMFIWHFGFGVVLNVVVAIITAIICEAAVLKLRSRSLESLTEGTAVLTGALLGLCLPPMLPFWMVAFGTGFALIFGKHLYGGSGSNIFNPAMVGFAVLIISFPLAMSHWPAPGKTELSKSFSTKLNANAPHPNYDGVTAATPLDAYKFRKSITNEEFFFPESLQYKNWQAWASINLAFLIGGLFLLNRKLIPWQLPVSFLTTLGVLSLIFYDGGSSKSLGSPIFTLFTGACMFTAFFIATDPVTSPGHRLGLLVFGAGAGLIAFIIRAWGAYPEGAAFAILLMNATTPLIDQVFSIRERSSKKSTVKSS